MGYEWFVLFWVAPSSKFLNQLICFGQRVIQGNVDDINGEERETKADCRRGWWEGKGEV